MMEGKRPSHPGEERGKENKHILSSSKEGDDKQRSTPDRKKSSAPEISNKELSKTKGGETDRTDERSKEEAPQKEVNLVGMLMREDVIAEHGWREILTGNKIPVENVDNAAELLDAFTKGRNAQVELLRSQGYTDFETPRIGLFSKNPGDNQIFTQELGPGIHCLGVSENYLSQQSREDLQNPIIHRNKNNEIIFQGSRVEYFELSGVHEAQHIADAQAGVDLQEVHNSNVIVGAEYNAQPHELVALQAELKHAKKRNMHPDTIACYERQIEEAIAYREKNFKDD